VVLTRLTSKQLERLVNICRSVPLADSPTALDRQKPRRPRRLTDAQRVKVRIAYKSGASMASQARRFHVTRETISRVIRGAGLTIREQRNFSPEQIAEAVVLYRQGWSLAQLGERYGFDGQTIRTHLVRDGVVMRGPH
jgi:lambda repressor-like predicted transcriptional regulator